MPLSWSSAHLQNLSSNSPNTCINQNCSRRLVWFWEKHTVSVCTDVFADDALEMGFLFSLTAWLPKILGNLHLPRIKRSDPPFSLVYSLFNYYELDHHDLIYCILIIHYLWSKIQSRRAFCFLFFFCLPILESCLLKLFSIFHSTRRHLPYRDMQNGLYL